MKNKFLKSLSDTFKSGCVIFTFIVFAFYILGNAISSAVQVLTLTNLFLLLLFAIWFAGSNTFLKSNKLNKVVGVILHFISTMIGFFIIFVYLPGNLENKSRAFVLTVGFGAAYILVAILIFAVNNAIKNTKNKNSKINSVSDETSND